MKLKKQFSFTDKNQIWRLLISDQDKLLLETRNTESKEVFFHCTDLNNGKLIFKKLQFEEKFWIGIERIENDIIYFHNFARPNMPEHKKIIAYDLNKKKIIWQNDDLTFLTIIENKLYAFKKRFEGQDIFILNPITGEVFEELGNNPEILNVILNTSESLEDYSEYTYPERNSIQGNHLQELIDKETKQNSNIENIESMQLGSFLCFNYHFRNSNNLLENVFAVYDLDKRKKVVSEVINKNLNAFAPDSFFGYKNNLLVLKNKNELISYKIV